MKKMLLVLPDGTYGVYNEGEVILLSLEDLRDYEIDALTSDALSDYERYEHACNIVFSLYPGSEA